ENKSPWQLAVEKRPDITKEALMLPPVDLDALLHKKLVDQAIGGYDVYSTPYFIYFYLLFFCYPCSISTGWHFLDRSQSYVL
ncbi:MAG: hypothetical protein V1853_05005, partial [bacterium]